MRFIRPFTEALSNAKRIEKMESCKNCKHLKELDIHARNYECAKYVDKDGAQIMGENTIFAKVAMESKPAMCEEWEAKNA